MITLLMCAALAETPPVASQMHERFQTTMRIRNHVIQGQLDEVKALAKTLADPSPLEGLPESWAPRVAALNTHATQLANSENLTQAATNLAKLAYTCAECHAAFDGGPGLDGMRGVPPQRWSEGDNMPLHLWAVDWMWLGLVAPNDEAWSRGATELNSEPLNRRFGDNEKTAKGLETRVYELAKRAGTLGPNAHAERADVVGQLLSTCATCHLLRDVANAPPPETP